MGNVLVLDHQLIQHKVTLMRKPETNNKEFRELAKEVVTLMGYEATRNLPLMDVEIETPQFLPSASKRPLFRVY